MNKIKLTQVKFLIEPVTNNVMAYFPKENHAFNGYRNDNKVCYAHVGQHSSCAPEYARKCKEATQDQYRDLLTELTVIGYTDLKILNKDWTN